MLRSSPAKKRIAPSIQRPLQRCHTCDHPAQSAACRSAAPLPLQARGTSAHSRGRVASRGTGTTSPRAVALGSLCPSRAMRPRGRTSFATRPIPLRAERPPSAFSSPRYAWPYAFPPRVRRRSTCAAERAAWSDIFQPRQARSGRAYFLGRMRGGKA